MRNGGYDGEEFQCGRETAGQRAGAVSREDILGIGSGFTDMHGGIACSSGFSAADTLHNRFSVGENTSRIEERFGTYGSFEKGVSYEKRVAVKNTGSIPCLVRIFAEIEDPDCREKIQIDLNKKDWSEKQEDGFYYYQHVLLPGQTSEPLFTTIKAEEDINDFRMICFSETIQSDGQKGGAVKWADQ